MEHYEERTAFNMGLATLERMNNLLIDLHNFNLEQNIPAMKNNLYEIWKEIFPFLKNDERDKGDELWANIDNCNIDQVDSTTISFDINLTKELNFFDFWLRDMMNKKGLLMPKSDDPHSAIFKGV